jgi:hypothetical protein
MANQFPDATKKVISPAAQAVWEAFNEDEAGVFVDYGEKLAAALRAAADQVVPFPGRYPMNEYMEGFRDAKHSVHHQLLAIAAELESAGA